MIQKIREKLNIRTVIHVVPTALFLLFTFSVMIFSYTGKVKKAVIDTKLSVKSLEELSDSFEETLRDNIYNKNNFIDLNGLVVRLEGINSLNERQKQLNGHLCGFGNASKDAVLECASNLIELADFLDNQGIDFLYLMAPNKLSFYDTHFAPGYSSTSAQNIDFWEEALNEAEIMNIDMDAWFEANGWDMDDVFFKTDHHWKPEAGLAASKVTMEFLSQNGIADYKREWLEQDSWNTTILEKWFLGSSGKRTGTLYTGVDDFTVFEPKFETDYRYSGLRNNSTNWVYHNDILDLSYMTERDYFNKNPYNMYMYGDYPIRTTINNCAPNEKRLMIMGDSYKIPYEYFLSTQFREVYTIDLRYYTDGTFVQYVDEVKPDIVIFCTQTTTSMDEYFHFGLEDYLTAIETTDQDELEVNILNKGFIEAQEENANNFIVMCDNLEPNQTYTLTLDSTTYEGGEDLYVQMSLQNISSNNAIYNRYFDANSNLAQKWIFTIPDDLTGEYSIYLYAGTKGHTDNISVEVSNVKLRKGIFED